MALALAIRRLSLPCVGASDLQVRIDCLVRGLAGGSALEASCEIWRLLPRCLLRDIVCVGLSARQKELFDFAGASWALLSAAGVACRAGCGCGVGITGCAAAGCGGAGRAKNWVCWLCCDCSWNCLAGGVHVRLAMRLRRWMAKPWNAWRDKREGRLPADIPGYLSDPEGDMPNERGRRQRFCAVGGTTPGRRR